MPQPKVFKIHWACNFSQKNVKFPWKTESTIYQTSPDSGLQPFHTAIFSNHTSGTCRVVSPEFLNITTKKNFFLKTQHQLAVHLLKGKYSPHQTNFMSMKFTKELSIHPQTYLGLHSRGNDMLARNLSTVVINNIHEKNPYQRKFSISAFHHEEAKIGGMRSYWLNWDFTFP